MSCVFRRLSADLSLIAVNTRIRKLFASTAAVAANTIMTLIKVAPVARTVACSPFRAPPGAVQGVIILTSHDKFAHALTDRLADVCNKFTTNRQLSGFLGSVLTRALVRRHSLGPWPALSGACGLDRQ